MKTNNIMTVAAIAVATAMLASCSDDKAVSVSPQLGGLSVTPAADNASQTLYTKQFANVQVSYGSLGEHVYFSSYDKFVCTVSKEGYSQTDSIPVFETQDLRVPTDFTFRVAMPPTAGTYTITFTTPFVQKAAGSGEVGETIYFNRLSASTTIRVVQSDVTGANFGDTREHLAKALLLTDCTLNDSIQPDNDTYDHEVKSVKLTTGSNVFTAARYYLFQNNRLAAMSEQWRESDEQQSLDENGMVKPHTVTDSTVVAYMDEAAKLFAINKDVWAADQANLMEPANAGLADKYRGVLSKTNSKNAEHKLLWTELINAMLRGDITSFSDIYHYEDDNEQVVSRCTLSVYVRYGRLYMQKLYKKD